MELLGAYLLWVLLVAAVVGLIWFRLAAEQWVGEWMDYNGPWGHP